jgi:hypothetical protein
VKLKSFFPNPLSAGSVGIEFESGREKVEPHK